MSQAPLCEVHSEREASYIVGMAETGEQLFLCVECGAHFGLTLALATLDPAEIVNAASAIKATPAADGATPEAPANKPARKRTAKPKPKPATEPESRLPEAPPTADQR